MKIKFFNHPTVPSSSSHSSINYIILLFTIRVPLIVEVWGKSGNHKDQLVGLAQIPLSHVFFVSSNQVVQVKFIQLLRSLLP